MNELPPGWTERPLSEIVDILDAVRVPVNATEREARNAGKRGDELYPYYGATGQVGEIDGFLFDEPLILLGEDGVPFLDPMRPKAYRVEGKYWVNNHAHVLRARPGVADARFITGFLNSFDYTGFVTGSTRLKLTQAAMRAIPVPLAPLDEQRRIADKLDALLARVDACRKRLDRVPGVLRQFRQAVLDAATSGGLTGHLRVDPFGENSVELEPYLEEQGRFSSARLPTGWRWLSFEKVFSDLTDSKLKLPQSDYQADGVLPVVDQGEGIIGGYTSRLELRSRAIPPVVVFGDHTRCVKWVDTPFVQGADGVKVLSPNVEVVLARYAYFALLACRLPDKGYSRHMRFLRATVFPVPPLDEQAAIIRRTESLLLGGDRSGATIEEARAQIAPLVSTILARAFRGELL